MTSAVETASGHHRAWYEPVGVGSSSRTNDDSAADSMTSSMVEHFFGHHNTAAALEPSSPRDYRSTGHYSRDMLVGSRYYQHYHAATAAASHGEYNIYI